MSDDPLDEIIEEAQEKSQEFSEAQKKIQKVKTNLREQVEALYDKEVIKDDERETALSQIDRGQYGRVRDTIKEAKQGVSIDFDDKEKAEFAKSFKSAYDNMEAYVEEIRNELVSLTDSMDDDDMIAYIYGKHSGMRKRDLRKAFEIIDGFRSSSVKDEDIARFMASKTSKLTISDCKDIVKSIREAGK